jgi:hypothetical protein
VDQSLFSEQFWSLFDRMTALVLCCLFLGNEGSLTVVQRSTQDRASPALPGYFQTLTLLAFQMLKEQPVRAIRVLQLPPRLVISPDITGATASAVVAIVLGELTKLLRPAVPAFAYGKCHGVPLTLCTG